jgi:2-oxoglutarate dehydrogenase complex dehydrogenase (E1) component-like enzyme
MILDRLIWSDSFERFVATKYPNEKRFGLEGCESLIPGMKALVIIINIEKFFIGTKFIHPFLIRLISLLNWV